MLSFRDLAELSEKIMELAPENTESNKVKTEYKECGVYSVFDNRHVCINFSWVLQVPYLACGDSISLRNALVEGTCSKRGDYVIEDVTIEKDVFRRLVLTEPQPNQILIEAKVVQRKFASLISYN